MLVPGWYRKQRVQDEHVKQAALALWAQVKFRLNKIRIVLVYKTSTYIGVLFLQSNVTQFCR